MPPGPVEPADDGDDNGIFAECLTEAHAQFTLAMLDAEHDDLTEGEKMLVEVALAAGCVGALTVLNREDGD